MVSDGREGVEEAGEEAAERNGQTGVGGGSLLRTLEAAAAQRPSAPALRPEAEASAQSEALTLATVKAPDGEHGWRVYIVQSASGHLKLGVSRNVKARAEQLQHWAPFELRIVGIFPVRYRPTDGWHHDKRGDAFEMEAIAHASLWPWSAGREWYHSTPESIAAIRGWLVSGLPRRPRGLGNIIRDARRAWLRKHFWPERAR